MNFLFKVDEVQKIQLIQDILSEITNNRYAKYVKLFVPFLKY